MHRPYADAVVGTRKRFSQCGESDGVAVDVPVERVRAVAMLRRVRGDGKDVVAEARGGDAAERDARIQIFREPRLELEDRARDGVLVAESQQVVAVEARDVRPPRQRGGEGRGARTPIRSRYLVSAATRSTSFRETETQSSRRRIPPTCAR